jgi:hypothetical protein
MPMTTHTLRRWGAVLLSGGLCLAAAYLFYPSSAHSSLIRPAATLGLVGVLLALPGLVAYQRGQSGRAGVNGWIGTTILCLGLAILEIPHLMLGAFSPSSLYDLDRYHGSLWGQLEFVGIVGIAVGLIVLAVATRRSGTYPRWAFWTLIANIAVSAVGSSVGSVADAVRQPAPSYFLMALSGLAMIRLAQQRSSGARSTARVGVSEEATSGAL